MAPLNLMLCVYQILPKILRALVYLAQKFLVLQDPALQAFHYCSKFFIFPSKGKVLFFYEQTYFPPLSYWSQIKSNTMSHYIKWDSEILFPLSVIYHSYIVYYYQYWEIYILYPSLSNCIEYRVNFTSTIIPVSTKLLLMICVLNTCNSLFVMVPFLPHPVSKMDISLSSSSSRFSIHQSATRIFVALLLSNCA